MTNRLLAVHPSARPPLRMLWLELSGKLGGCRAHRSLVPSSSSWAQGGYHVHFVHRLHTTNHERIHRTTSLAQEAAPVELREETAVATDNTVAPSLREGPIVTPWISRLTSGVWETKFLVAGGNAGKTQPWIINLKKNTKTSMAHREGRLWKGMGRLQIFRSIGHRLWARKPSKIYLKGLPEIRAKGMSFRPGDFVCVRLGGKKSMTIEAEFKKKDPVYLTEHYENSEDLSEEIASMSKLLGEKRITHTRAAKVEQFRIGKIEHIIHDSVEGIFIHCRWLDFARNTLLEDMAAPQELVLLTSCSTVQAERILRKVEVSALPAGKQEPGIKPGEPRYFYRFHYDKSLRKFEDLAIHENAIKDFIYCPNNLGCESCEMKKRNLRDCVALHGDEDNKSSFQLEGTTYRPGDFVYFIKQGDKHDQPFHIGQVLGIENMSKLQKKVEVVTSKIKVSHFNLKRSFHPERTVSVRRLRTRGVEVSQVVVKIAQLPRYDDDEKDITMWRHYHGNSHSPLLQDNRRLHFRGDTCEIDGDDIRGKCFVKYRAEVEDMEQWKDSSPHAFWIEGSPRTEIEDILGETQNLSLEAPNKQSTRGEKLLPPHPVTESERLLDEEQTRRLLESGRKLRALDVFAGAGGLTLGLEMSGVVDTKWAIEFDSNAAEAFRRNKPNSVVYNQCANKLLDQAAREFKSGGKTEPLLDCMDNRLPPMPQRGEVDFIYGGPPCQSFSAMNPLRAAEDSKNALIPTYLSYLDYYRPSYFLLENVTGMLMNRLADQQMGVAKFILRAMTSMGYQAKIGVLQAAMHGVPQFRRRLFFWGAKSGCKLPEFPQPTHCFKAWGMNINAPEGTTFTHLKNAGRYARAPHRSVTIGDAISDLPGFEYKNPHIFLEETRKEVKEAKLRSAIYPTYEPYGRYYAGNTNPQSYGTPPRTEFQRYCRQGVADDNLTLHYTRGYSDPAVLERVVNVPLRPGANAKDLPSQLRPERFAAQGIADSDDEEGSEGESNWQTVPYGRLDSDGYFPTALTDINPTTAPGKVLHPHQRRVITIREHARSQGFPDRTVFYTSVKGPIRKGNKHILEQIGNAVPVPLGKALGDELRRALLADFVKNHPM